jgi:hypothetical protein
MTTTTLHAPQVEYRRGQLADGMETLGPGDWSVALMQTLVALFDLAIRNGGLQDRPAQVLTLVREP